MTQKQEHTGNAEKAEWKTTQADTTLEMMINTIGDSLNNLAICSEEEDGDGKYDVGAHPKLGTLSKYDTPCGMTGTIFKAVPIQTKQFA